MKKLVLKQIISILLSISIFFQCNMLNTARVFIGISAVELSIAENSYAADSVYRGNKSQTIAVLLALLCGFHHFYLKNNITGIIYIFLGLVYGLGEVLSLIDFLIMVNMSDEEWKEYLYSGRSMLWTK